MNINITISSDSSESRSIHLLTEVVECLQSEKIKLNEKIITLNSRKKISKSSWLNNWRNASCWKLKKKS